ncbi:helix-turn-helix domain-containing protein [bacterium AH-315-E07]|nr:helix-turn-helix domain-containing protein [bacterium AH-315-E07]
MTNHPSLIKIGIINYPGAMQSAVQGLKEMFLLANEICQQREIEQLFSIELYDIAAIQQSMADIKSNKKPSLLQVILIPPNIVGEYYLSPEQQLKNWILLHHARGTVVCSACAGAFILASTCLLKNRQATTHWKLASQFSLEYPQVRLDINKILINDGDIITAAGLMSWIDLGLELVAQFTHPSVMRQLGKYLIVDTGLREQRYYQSFYPKLDHGDSVILKAQHYLQAHFHGPITVTTLSTLSCLTNRTFLRRFTKATGLKPTQYLQRLRIQKACDLIETTNETFEAISLKIGYQDTSAFRKIFLKVIGLTPRDFKNRFTGG